MDKASLLRRLTNALGMTRPELALPSYAEVAQQGRDNDARRRFEQAGRMLEVPLSTESGPGAAQSQITTVAPSRELPEALKKAYSERWQSVLQNETSRDAYEKVKSLGSDIARVSGNKKNVHDLTDSDFKAFGISRDAYMAVLSRTAMDTAVLGFKQVLEGGKSDMFGAMHNVESVLADTDYAKKGGMRHAKQVLISMSGYNASVDTLDQFTQSLGKLVAYELGNDYKNGSHAPYVMRRIVDAIAMAGENPADENTIRKYTGDSREGFLNRLGADAGEELARGSNLDYDLFRETRSRMGLSVKSGVARQ